MIIAPLVENWLLNMCIDASFVLVVLNRVKKMVFGKVKFLGGFLNRLAQLNCDFFQRVTKNRQSEPFVPD